MNFFNKNNSNDEIICIYREFIIKVHTSKAIYFGETFSRITSYSTWRPSVMMKPCLKPKQASSRALCWGITVPPWWITQNVSKLTLFAIYCVVTQQQA